MNAILKLIKALKIQGLAGVKKVTHKNQNEEESTVFFIPLLRKPSEEEWKQLITLDSSLILECIQDPSLGMKKEIETPFSKLVEFIKSQLPSSNQDEEWIQLLPRKWEKIGQIIVIKKLHPKLSSIEKLIGKGLAIANSSINEFNKDTIKTVLVDEEGIQGELRQPTIRILFSNQTIEEQTTIINNNSNDNDNILSHFNSLQSALQYPTCTVHVENNIKYFLDVQRVMFASGNGTERMHFSNLNCNGETIVDMFCGIGYFSIPLILHSRLKQILCLEKNPISFACLQLNFELNGIDIFKTNDVKCELGDNREVGNQFLGTANRVLMGYIPTPKQFLFRAFDFLMNGKGVLHYHHICTKNEFQVLAMNHVQEELNLWIKERNIQDSLQIQILDFRIVKSYSPKQFHCVADIKIY